MEAQYTPEDIALITSLLLQIGEIDSIEGILDTALQQAAAAIHASQGIALILDEAGLPLRTAFFYRKELTEDRLQDFLRQMAIETTVDLWIADTRETRLPQYLWQGKPFDSMDKPRSLLGAPIRGQNYRGYILLCHPAPGVFTHRHAAILKTIAAGTSLAIARALISPQGETQPSEVTDLWVTSIIHDIRSPITNLIGSLNALSTTPAVNADVSSASLLAIAQRSAQRLDRLSLALMDTLRLRAGQAVAQFKKISPHAILDAAAAEMEDLISHFGHTLTRIETKLPVSIHADAGLLERVLINLLENAARYSPQGSHLTLSATGTPDSIIFSVQDEGPGIPAERLELLFTPYQPQATGTGLGLAYCKLAVNAHGGKIWVENLPEHGSIFYFTIPAPAADRQGA